ncbi:MAG: Rieske 2Fe-2S domain-containing protein [Pseudomonadota bacterium]
MSEAGLRIADIPEDGSKEFEHGKEKLFAVRKEGRIFVYKNSCPHIGVALNWEQDKFLDSSNSMIQCANHGALFVIENGNCVAGPCTGAKLTSVVFDIIDGVICPR